MKIVGKIGLDMTRWPTGKHFASWLSLSPLSLAGVRVGTQHLRRNPKARAIGYARKIRTTVPVTEGVRL